MDLDKQLMHMEEQFWKGGADFYRQNLTSDSLMVFAEPVGILTKEEVVETIAASPRWAEVRFREVRIVQLTDEPHPGVKGRDLGPCPWGIRQ